MIKVLIADDEPLVRAGIRAVLESAPGIVVTAEAGDGRAAVQAAIASRPDVALVDIKMPVLDGLAASGEIRRHAPGVRIVMLTSFGTQPNARRAVQEGAAGFILKASAPDELIRAVRSVKTYVSRILARLGCANRVQAALLARDAGA